VVRSADGIGQPVEHHPERAAPVAGGSRRAATGCRRPRVRTIPVSFPRHRRSETAVGIQHKRKELRTANKRRRKNRKHKARSTKKYKV
jgi:hypothetical protein